MALKKATRKEEEGGLTITSMMDMMTIILVFLLKSYSTDDISVAGSEDLVLPVSTTQVRPELAVNLVVTKSMVVVDGMEVLRLTEEADEENPGDMVIAVPGDEKKGQLITRLYDRLLEKAEDAKQLAEMTASEDHEFKGRILLQCDKELPFSVIREVMYTAGQAQFSEFRFVVYQGGV
jgi:biopolymer transport protein ExbD